MRIAPTARQNLTELISHTDPHWTSTSRLHANTIDALMELYKEKGLSEDEALLLALAISNYIVHVANQSLEVYSADDACLIRWETLVQLVSALLQDDNQYQSPPNIDPQENIKGYRLLWHHWDERFPLALAVEIERNIGIYRSHVLGDGAVEVDRKTYVVTWRVLQAISTKSVPPVASC